MRSLTLALQRQKDRELLELLTRPLEGVPMMKPIQIGGGKGDPVLLAMEKPPWWARLVVGR